MTYEDKVILADRLQRAEYLLRAEAISCKITKHKILSLANQQSDELSLQSDNILKRADLLCEARRELWRNIDSEES